MRRLATYAKQVQEAGMVPILEPEVLLEGKHSRARARAVIQETLGTLFSVVKEHAVDRRALILKTSMVLSGSKSGKKDTPEEVAEDTVGTLMETVPTDVAGIVFLSGGQTSDEATANLAAINHRATEVRAAWPLTFSYARALQDEALTVWQGKEGNIPLARQAFLTRLKKVAAALPAG